MTCDSTNIVYKNSLFEMHMGQNQQTCEFYNRHTIIKIKLSKNQIVRSLTVIFNPLTISAFCKDSLRTMFCRTSFHYWVSSSDTSSQNNSETATCIIIFYTE